MFTPVITLRCPVSSWRKLKYLQKSMKMGLIKISLTWKKYKKNSSKTTKHQKQYLMKNQRENMASQQWQRNASLDYP